MVDEASMVGTRDWKVILERVLKNNAKLIIVGDGRQFSAIDAGDMHRFMEDNVKESSRFVLTEMVIPPKIKGSKSRIIKSYAA